MARQIAVLYLLYLEKQVDPELLRQITAKANAIEKTFNAYRANVNGRQMTDSEVRKVLKESRNSAERKAVWEGSKGVGPLVEADLKALVKLRNEAARKLGFPNYHALQLHLNEQSQEQVLKLFDELDDVDTRAVPQAQARDRREAGRTERRVGRRSCAPGIITTRSSRSRRRSSPPTSTRSTPRPTSSSFAAISTPASACRSTT